MEYRGNMFLKDKKVLVVVAKFNEIITSKLLSGALSTLKSHGLSEDDIDVVHVGGAVEVGQYVNMALSKVNNVYHGVLALACVIRGATSHYDYVCSAVTQATMNASFKYDIPVSFGVLTVDTLEQAFDRCGGKQGNKGSECAVSLIEMIDLGDKLNEKMEKEVVEEPSQRDEYY